ncbi:MAG TPA: ABC transporter ATP-binding protein [Geopsychrobacteraceae bacterium]|nr:ABC transporter ATP-binding protein [Geopsychrobacteraceae bacterium]
MSLIQLTNVFKTYKSGVQLVEAVRDVDLLIEPGAFAVLAGPSGSGKTTLLNMIGGLDQPSQGRVMVEELNLGTCSASQLADFRLRRIGFIFQSFNLIPVLTAQENAEFVLMLQKVPVEDRQARVSVLFAELGISGLEQRKPMELSGGQQQRVAIARAMASQPAVVLADEPTANLDSETATDLLYLMRRLNHEQGTTFLFSSHDQKVIDHADRVILLEDGRIMS